MAGTAPNSTDCRAYYKLEDNSDETGTYGLTVNGATSGVTGILDDCYSLDGTNDSLSAPAGLTNFGSGSFSFNLWVKTSSTDKYIFAQGLSGDNQIINGYVGATGKFSLTLEGTGNQFSGGDSVSSINTDSWVMITAVMDRTNEDMIYYINGSLDKTIDASGASIGDFNMVQTFYWFAKQDGTTTMAGLGDELSVFDIALTADNVEYLYNEGTPTSAQQYPFSAGSSAELAKINGISLTTP